MPIKKLTDCACFTAGDGCRLREILHPDKEDIAIRYSLAHATVQPGQRTAPHRLRTTEVYYVLSGRGEMVVDGKTANVGPDDTVVIPPDAVQCITNTGNHDLTFVCMVDPAWRVEDEEILGSGE